MSFWRDRVALILVTLFRLTLSAWVGGAVLFVITSVAEQSSPQFDSRIRDQLATIRFPLYYLYGGIILGIACSAGIGAVLLCRGCLRKRMAAALVLALLASAGAAVDYVLVFRPLQQLIVPPGQAKSQQFGVLHERSRQANEIHVTLALMAAACACLPGSRSLQGSL